MVRIILVYESKYGNTELVTEIIGEEIKNKGIETTLYKLKELNLDKVGDYKAILIGSPNHFGGPTRSIRKFIDNLGKLDLKKMSVAVFDTYMGNDFEKAVKKMEKRINEKAPDLKLIIPGLSMKVQGLKGQIIKEELPKCKAFGDKIATQIKA